MGRFGTPRQRRSVHEEEKKKRNEQEGGHIHTPTTADSAHLAASSLCTAHSSLLTPHSSIDLARKPARATTAATCAAEAASSPASHLPLAVNSSHLANARGRPDTRESATDGSAAVEREREGERKGERKGVRPGYLHSTRTRRSLIVDLSYPLGFCASATTDRAWRRRGRARRPRPPPSRRPRDRTTAPPGRLGARR